MISSIKGDAFATRNMYAIILDLEKHPAMFQITETHKPWTWLLHRHSPYISLRREVVKKINSALGAKSTKKKEDENGKKENSKNRKSK